MKLGVSDIREAGLANQPRTLPMSPTMLITTKMMRILWIEIKPDALVDVIGCFLFLSIFKNAEQKVNSRKTTKSSLLNPPCKSADFHLRVPGATNQSN
jgi:hypothetical protein